MLKSLNHEYECTTKCKLRSHGNIISAALTKCSVADDKLAAFVAKTCCNFTDIVDDLGRSAVHLAASVNRYAILEWLLNQGAKINGQDFESGSTPLHRALYYGCIDCAVLLLRYGANLDAEDADTFCPLQNVCRLMDLPEIQREANDIKSVMYKRNHLSITENELLVWGSNKNYNLGIGIEDGPATPQAVNFFRKARISVIQVAMGSFHTLFLDNKYQLYAAGHGKGGRLGNNTESSQPAPKKIKVPIKNSGECICCLSVSNKHSLVLTDRSAVFACGLNDDQQLGVRGAGDKLTVFKEVIALRDFGVENLIGIKARDSYSLAFSNKSVYYWGRNMGQFGIHDGPELIPTPTQLKLPKDVIIRAVECNNAAIVILTEKSKILLYYNGTMKVKNSPNYVPLKAVCLHGGDSIKYSKGSPSALKLLLLDEMNGIYFWYENTKLFYRCKLTQIRLTQIDKIMYRTNKVLILSDCYIYEGKCKHLETAAHAETDTYNSWMSFKMPQMSSVSTDHTSRIELKRLPNVDRVLNIFANEDFNAFALLQENSYKYFKIPKLQNEWYSFKKLYADVCEDDAVHDVIFHISGQKFPAHKLVIYARASGLKSAIEESLDKHVYLKENLLTPKMFELMLKNIYMNKYGQEDDYEEIGKSLEPNRPNSMFEIYEIFLKHVEKFCLTDLASHLQNKIRKIQNNCTNAFCIIMTPLNCLRRSEYPELYDVRIICAGDMEIPAHKCVLMERLEYFDMMFAHTWAEQSVVTLATVPLEYMQPIVDFIYSDDEEYIRRQQYRESFLYNMIVLCDQFLFERLRQVCELLLVEKITLRKCGEMLDFSCTYNCQLLRNTCLDFICQNLSRVLTYRSLENCEPATLRHINAHYRKMFRKVEYRMITPDSTAIEDELLLSYVDDCIVDMNYCPSEIEKTCSKQRTSKLTPKSLTRQHERDAIFSMMKSLNDTENESNHTKSDENPNDTAKVIKEAQKMGEQLQENAKNWCLVSEKTSEQKKKQNWRAVPLNANEILKDEHAAIEMKHLNVKREEKITISQPIAEETSPTVRPLNLADLADFTSAREKLSQKQRKRLSSTSTASLSLNSSILSPESKNNFEATSPPTNAWGVVSPPTAWADINIPAVGSAIDPDSFANKLRIRRSSSTTSPTRAIVGQGKNFMQIQAEERKEREHYERMRNKSLALTQIEETAIAELRAFYNVDNVTDEIITIERKPMTTQSVNFAIWKKN